MRSWAKSCEIGDGVAGLEPQTRVTGLIHQGFAEYAVAPARRVVPVPESLPDEAALGEPLSCVISGMRRTAIDLGDTVAVVGLGFMGLLTLQTARLKGPAELIAIDTREVARQRALDYGADRILQPSDLPPSLILDAWEDMPKGHGVDVAIEAAGNAHALALAGRMVKEHGVLSIVGYHQGQPVPVDMELWNWKALTVLNAHERREAVPDGLYAARSQAGRSGQTQASPPGHAHVLARASGRRLRCHPREAR